MSGARKGPQRQRHGVKKKLVEGTGGLLVGAALVVFVRGLIKQRRRAPAKQHSQSQPEHSP